MESLVIIISTHVPVVNLDLTAKAHVVSMTQRFRMANQGS